MKTSRQNVILDIIANEDVETQHQLMEALINRGVKSTQATVSRDIKELRLIKELSTGGRYRYVAAERDDLQDYDLRLRKIFRESVISHAVAQNIIVIKTLPGLADAACSTLDGMDIKELVGSLAGDDTAFLAMKTNEAAEKLCKEIEELL